MTTAVTIAGTTIKPTERAYWCHLKPHELADAHEHYDFMFDGGTLVAATWHDFYKAWLVIVT